ncbi:DoxX family protein [Rhizobium sp.]|jgi:uncharacterized membrane protein YphA (DoxX/SURF4 family)|uniref:DoxX family protein n=1 Tax=Rhizobium sp. TaxID=391 RepID=UPI002AA872EE
MHALETTLKSLARPILGAAWIRFFAYLGLCAAYLQGGLNKLIDFNDAIGEIVHFGLLPAPLFAVLVIILELAASVMILTGFFRWLGALGLAALTLLATFWPCTSGNYPWVRTGSWPPIPSPIPLAVTL